ncbi:integrase core domain-containing protein [Roseovarius sp. MS2]|uniref:integrase core domain-containing protein n=1 Tax=Roseovarius sp. MS2 TaxID=3390728 RepID=UPI003EDC8FF4
MRHHGQAEARTTVNDWLTRAEPFHVDHVREAQILIEKWRRHYNTVRPHSALGYRPPVPESIVPIDQRA